MAVTKKPLKSFKSPLIPNREYEIPQIDNTLTVSGAAADAKETGDRITNVTGSVAPIYSASSTYAVGDYVMYGNKLYRCKTAINTAEAWTVAHWDLVEVTDEISQLKEDLSVYGSYLYGNGLIDVELENGGINTSGLPVDTSVRVRSKYITVPENTDIAFALTSSNTIIWSVSFYTVNDGITPRLSYTDYAEYENPVSVHVPSGARYIRFLLKYEDDASIDASDITSFALTTHGIRHIVRNDVYYPDQNVTYKKGGYGATGTLSTSTNGVSTDMLTLAGAVLLIGSCRAALLLYKDGVYQGKINSSDGIDKVGGNWMYFYEYIDVAKYLDRFGCNGFAITVLPTDSTTITDDTYAGTYASSHIIFRPYTIINQCINDIRYVSDITSRNVGDTAVVSGFRQGGYNRRGKSSSAGFLVTTENYLPTGYDNIIFDDGFLGVLFAWDDDNNYYGGSCSDYALTGGYYVPDFYFVNKIDIGYFQRTYPDLNFKLTVKKSDDSSMYPKDAEGHVKLEKLNCAPKGYVNRRTSGDNYTPGFGYSLASSIISIGHKGGGWSAYPENTAIGIIEGVRRGMRYIEADVQFTSDNVPVMIHDETINRTARNADGTEISNTIYIKDITYAEASEYDWGIYKGDEFAGTPLLTFDDYILLCKNLQAVPVIELKAGAEDYSIFTTTRVAQLVSIVTRYSMQNLCCWISFNTDAVVKVESICNNSCFGLAISDGTLANDVALYTRLCDIKGLRSNGNFAFATIKKELLTQSVINMLAVEGIPLVVYFINSTSDAIALKTNGQIIGGMTDYAIDIGTEIKNSIVNS